MLTKVSKRVPVEDSERYVFQTTWRFLGVVVFRSTSY